MNKISPARPSRALTRMQAEALHSEWVAYHEEQFAAERARLEREFAEATSAFADREKSADEKALNEIAEALIRDEPDLEAALAVLHERFPPMASVGQGEDHG